MSVLGVRSPPQGLPRRDDHTVELGGIAHRDHLPSILRHLLVDEAHLLVREIATAEILLREARKELRIAAAEADAVVMAGDLRRLLVGGLIFLIDPNESLQGPDLVRSEHLLDVLKSVFLGGVHRAHTLAHLLKKTS